MTFTLYYHTIHPMARLAKLLLHEKQVEYSLINTEFWLRQREFLRLNPTAELPILVTSDEDIIRGIYPFVEYIATLAPDRPTIGESEGEKAEIRHLIYWFTHKIYHEVTNLLITEKLLRYYTKMGYPDTEVIRAAKLNLQNHLNYCEYLLGRNSWLAGENLTIADFAAASQLSVLDYLGEITWSKFPASKEWYALLKSRPSFRAILEEKIDGFPPSSHYHDLDF